MTQAQEKFYEAQTEALQELARLQKLVTEMGAKVAESPENWGYVGNMGRIIEQLQQVR